MLRFFFRKHSSPQWEYHYSFAMSLRATSGCILCFIDYLSVFVIRHIFLYLHLFIIYCTLSRCRWLFNGSSVLQPHPIRSDTCFSEILLRETLSVQIGLQKKTVLFPGRRSWVRFEAGRTALCKYLWKWTWGCRKNRRIYFFNILLKFCTNLYRRRKLPFISSICYRFIANYTKTLKVYFRTKSFSAVQWNYKAIFLSPVIKIQLHGVFFSIFVSCAVCCIIFQDFSFEWIWKAKPKKCYFFAIEQQIFRTIWEKG